MTSRVHVVSYGLTTGLAHGAEGNWSRLRAGHSSVAPISRFPVDHLPVRIASTVEYPDADCTSSRSLCLAREVANEAVKKVPALAPFLPNARLLLATAKPQREWPLAIDAMLRADKAAYDKLIQGESVSLFGRELSRHLGTSGIWDNLDTACASAATAIQLAWELIRDEVIEVAVVIGAEASVFEEQIVRFALLSALSKRNDEPDKASRPFNSDRDGFVMGEAGACLVLCSERIVDKCGLHPLAEIAGCGDATDNYHMTRSSPDARAPAAAMRKALAAASLPIHELQHINAHGTSTPENDKIESLAIRSVLGEFVHSAPVTANKSLIGHSLSACGAVEGVLSVMSLVKKEMLGTLNYDNPDETLGLNIVGKTIASPGLTSVLCNSFGFGGQNVSVLYRSAS